MENEKEIEYVEREAVLAKGAPIPGWFCNMISAWDVINLPAADVAAVRHGRWESHLMPLAYRCSVCGYKPSVKAWKFHKRNYCPNCGAKMDMKG